MPTVLRRCRRLAAFATLLLAGVLLPMGGPSAGAIATEVPLGTAGSFAVLGGEAVTNTGPSVVTGDLGVSPGSAISGFPPGLVVGGVFHQTDAVALQAQTDLIVAYDDAAGQATDAALPPDAGGLTLVPGVYTAPDSLGLTGTLTLDAQGDPGAVWVFQVGFALTTATGSQVALVNGASPCHVTWQIGSSATLGTGSTMVGDVLALTSITATTGATVDGRLLARTGSVTLDTNTITSAPCPVAQPAVVATATATAPLGSAITAVGSVTGGDHPTGTMTFALFGPSDPTATGTPVYTSTVPVTGNGPYPSGPFTPVEPGDHHWVVSYSGDAGNASASSANGAAGSISTVIAAGGTPTSTTTAATASTAPASTPGTPGATTPPRLLARTGSGNGRLLLLAAGAILAGAGLTELGRPRHAGSRRAPTRP
jgi:hypothetical protein